MLLDHFLCYSWVCSACGRFHIKPLMLTGLWISCCAANRSCDLSCVDCYSKRSIVQLGVQVLYCKDNILHMPADCS